MTQENSRLALKNAILLVVLVGLQGIFAVYAYKHTDEMATVLKSSFVTIWKQRENNGSITVETIQQKHQCCGNQGPKDWGNVDLAFFTWSKIPNSCCAREVICNEKNAFERGCGEVLFKLIQDYGLLFKW